MTDKEKYKEFLNALCEILGFNKPIDILNLCKITIDFTRPYEMKIKELEQENEQLKKKIGVMQSCHFNGCIGCNDKKCKVKE